MLTIFEIITHIIAFLVALFGAFYTLGRNYFDSRRVKQTLLARENSATSRIKNID